MQILTRRGFVKMAGFVSAAGIAGMSLAGCGSNQESKGASDTPSKVVVAMSTSSEPAAGFDPCIAWGCGEHVHEPLIQSTLITTDINLEFVNDLATEYSCSDDGLTWTFKIRDDVKFTDGEPLTAKDVAFTINTINESKKSEADLSSVKKAVAVDDTTVEFRMSKPNNTLLYTLAVVGIVPEHAYDNNYGAAPIGTGRYKMVQWDKGQQVIFEANPDYYGEPVKMQQLVVVFMDEDAALAGCQAGEIDIAYTSATMYDSVPEGYELLSCKSVDSRGISLPTLKAGSPQRVGMDGEKHDVGNDVTCDIAIRRAMNLAVDREKMITNVLNGYGTVAYSVGDGLPWSSDDMRVDMDVEAAKKMLDEAGWKLDGDFRSKDGVKASFDLYYAANDSSRQAMSYEFANQMAEIGIEVKCKGGDWDTDLYPHEFDTPILWGWGSNSPVEMYEINYSTGWGNVAAYDSKTVDKHLDAALAETKIEDSYDDYKLAMWDEAAQDGVAPKGQATWVWLANIDHLYFQKSGLDVAAQKPHPHGHGWSLVNNVDQWSWK